MRLLARLGVALYWSAEDERRLAVAEEAVAMARRLDDLPTLAYALANRQGATSSPDRTEESVHQALELFRLCESLGDPELELPARVRQIGYLLELDDLAGADVALETLVRLVAELSGPASAGLRATGTLAAGGDRGFVRGGRTANRRGRGAWRPAA